MVEESECSNFDRTIEQAILALKKGAHLLKCGRRGKPKFCPFRLSADEKYLIWYSGQQEKQLKLSSVIKISTGQKTINFQRQPQPDKENQSFSLIYANGKRSLDLICKDKAQAHSWSMGLRAVISRFQRSQPFASLRNHRGAQSCLSSPAGYIRRKHNLGISDDAADFSQVHSLSGSPTQSLSERCFSDGLSLSSDSFCFSESSLPPMQNLVDEFVSNSPYVGVNLKKCVKDMSRSFVSPTYRPQVENSDILKDVLIWGEGVEGGNLGGTVPHLSNKSGMQVDALLPKLLESTMMLDVKNISLGEKHAALITKRGEVFCWGEGSGGKLGNKVSMDMSYPKVVESLECVQVKSVACSEFQTCAITKSGELYTWGDNKYGASLVDEVRTQPYKISGPFDGVTISKVACGEWHIATVSSSGQLFTFGDGTFGALGHGNVQTVYQPKEVESLKGLCVKSVACGPWHTAAIVDISSDRFKFTAIGGKLFTWGDGDKGRLGNCDMEKRLVPTCVRQLLEYDFVQVSCGRALTVALTNTGKVYTMGSSMHGQLGNPKAKDKYIALVQGKLKEEFVKEISTGSYHVAVLTGEGNVYTWGKGANGQLGLGNLEDRNSPTFVEALRDRQVESVACGSNLTAAICLHKSITVTDQSACSGCKLPFGLTRKKHNCYNCGLLFCHTCSSKKFINASLAPNRSRPSRVCDSCFNHLQKATISGRALKQDDHSPKQQLGTCKMSCDDKVSTGEGTSLGSHERSASQSFSVDSQDGQKKTPKTYRDKLNLLETESSSIAMPRWGQVSSPIVFDTCHIEKSFNPVASTGNRDEGLLEANKKLAEEVERLQAQVRRLEKKCESSSQKTKECQQNIDKTWLIAREEAAKRKAANEIAKALALKLHAMSEKKYAIREAKTGNDQNNATTNSPKPAFASIQLPPEINIPKDREIESLANSPIVFSNKLRSMDGRGLEHGSKQNGLRLEWVEQYEPGVYITFTILAGGQKGLKRVRFSRKRFAEREAERWWKENQVIVYHKYGIEGYVNSNQNQTRS